MRKFGPTAYELKAREQSRIAAARRKQDRADQTDIGRQRIADAEQFSAQCRQAWQTLEHCRKLLKRTGALKLAIIGSRSFCEPAPGKSHEELMTERRALGAALDLIAPTVVICGPDAGAARMALIWADRRGVSVDSAATPDAAVAFTLDTWAEDRLKRMEWAGVPVYRVAVV